MIDAKRYKGKIEVRKPFFGDAKLVIGGRDKTKLIVGLERCRGRLADVAHVIYVNSARYA